MSWSLIDTHAHLYSKEFIEDFDEVVTRAKSGKIQKILLPNIDEESIERMHLLVDEAPDFFIPMMGIHPCYVNENWETQISLVEQHLKSGRKYCAVGEIGIDLYWDKTMLFQQQQAFKAQIKLAIKYNLPIVIHARDSFDEIFEILDQENCPELTGVFHCFTGNLEQANKVIAYGGFKMGIGGVLTFKNSGLDKVIAAISMDHLILETDCPYLPPVPFRGKRNESSYLRYIAEKLAEVKECSLEEVAKVTSNNANTLFKL